MCPVDPGFPLWEPGDVRIVSEKRIREFIGRHPNSAGAMWHWADAIESGTWRNPVEIKGTFASVSFIGVLAVFNAGGNKYRIAAFVHYQKQIVFIKEIGTNEEYGQWVL
jgi:mRNA interferase HigB